MGLGRVGGERQSFRAKQGGKSSGTEDQGGEPPGSLRLGGQRPSGPGAKSAKSALSPEEKERVLCSENLHSWWEKRKKLHIG